MHLLVSKTNPDGDEILKAFNTGLKIIKDNGVYDRILSDHDMSFDNRVGT